MTTTYYVATFARYVLVEADDERQARERAVAELAERFADLSAKWGRHVPLVVRTVRPATADEISLWKLHQAQVAGELKSAKQPPRPGDRIRLLAMPADPHPVRIGEVGTVVSCRQCGSGQDAWHQIDVAWDSGRTLMLVWPPDEFEVVERANGK